MLELNVSKVIKDLYDEITTIPFYKEGNVYRYSEHLLKKSYSGSKYLEFIDMIPETIEREGVTDKDYLDFFNDSIEKLKEIEIEQTDYEEWLFDQKEAESIRYYQELIHDIHGGLNLLAYKEAMGDYNPQESESEGFEKVLLLGEYRRSIVLTDLNDYQNVEDNAVITNRKVLNKNNPFADVSIEDQKFLYSTEAGAFKTLELNTSYAMTRIQKDDTKSFLALQPGFKIRTSNKISGKNVSDITFDDTLTTEIAQDDKIYIYLDGAING